MGKRILFVVNPEAGRGEIRSKALDVIQLLTRAGHTVTVHPTSGSGEIVPLLERWGMCYDLVLASGGDGTLNETVSGLMALERRPQLAYIPAGTTNDTATNLQIPRNPVQAARLVLDGTEYPVDVCSFNDRWFLYVAAFGLFTDVAYATPQEQKHALGRLAYLLQGVKALSDVKVYHVKVTTPERVVEEDVILGMTCSTVSVAGFRPPELKELVSLNDGLSEIILVKRPKTLADFNNMAAAALKLDFQSDYFCFLQEKEAVFEFSEPVPWTLDGEYGGDVTRAEIRNHQSALRFCVPQIEG